MAGKRKKHVQSGLSMPKVEHHHDADGNLVVDHQAIPPLEKKVYLGKDATRGRYFDFSKHYGVGIDEIAYACQMQIQRFLSGEDARISVSTIINTANGVRFFLNYLALLASALRRTLTLNDVNRDAIDGYLQHLKDSGIAFSAQRVRYENAKRALTSLGRRGLISIVMVGDRRTFPKNAFPNSSKHSNGEKPLSHKERLAFSRAVWAETKPLFDDEPDVTSTLLTCCLLAIALHTGRNTTPLLEMTSDCLISHPKEGHQFLVLWKRRGHRASKVILSAPSSDDRQVDSMPGIKGRVITLIRRVIELAKPLRVEAPEHLASRIWLYRSRQKQQYRQVVALTESAIFNGTRELVEKHNLVGSDGKALRINVSRLRKTFANRVYELLDGDLASTAIALGNTPQVAGRHYMTPSEDAQRNWKFMGEAMTEELLNRTIGASERTPAGRCTDPHGGQYASKGPGNAACFSFLDCVRCRNYVVTGDDLYRLFSFYWRVLRERDQMDTRLWNKHYSHIPRIIERDVVAAGLNANVFKAQEVEEAKERARLDPHPFWRADALTTLDVFRQSLENDE